MSFDPVNVQYSLTELLQIGIAIVIFISGLLAVLYSIWGGFLLITSGGNEEKVKPAVNYIRHAFLGLIVLVIIIFVAPKVLSLFGLPFADEIQPSKIFSTMREISASIFGMSVESDTVLEGGTSIDELPSDFSDL